jgi:hypothetical protein
MLSKLVLHYIHKSIIKFLSALVWYGMVWYGMVWYGMVWYDLDGHWPVLTPWLKARPP